MLRSFFRFLQLEFTDFVRNSNKISLLLKLVLLILLLLVSLHFLMYLGESLVCLLSRDYCLPLSLLFRHWLGGFFGFSPPQRGVSADFRRSHALLRGISASCDGLAPLPVHLLPPTRLVLVLSTQKSGSTMFVEKLSSHPSVHLGREAFVSHRLGPICHPSQPCNAARLDKKLLQAFERAWADAARQGKAAAVLGFKIQYSQIPRALRAPLARWSACRGVAMLHLVRGCLAANLWTKKAERVDAVALGKKTIRDTDGDLAERLGTNAMAIAVDPKEAVHFVRKNEGEREEFRTLMRNFPKDVFYFEVRYEDLICTHARAHWAATLAAIGVASDDVDLLQDVLKRVHPGHISEKVANWWEVMRVLEGTETHGACQSVCT